MEIGDQIWWLGIGGEIGHGTITSFRDCLCVVDGKSYVHRSRARNTRKVVLDRKCTYHRAHLQELQGRLDLARKQVDAILRGIAAHEDLLAATEEEAKGEE